MTCQSATGGSGSCVVRVSILHLATSYGFDATLTSSPPSQVLQSTFVDGTSCGFGGRCNDGKCTTGSVLNTAKSWCKSTSSSNSNPPRSKLTCFFSSDLDLSNLNIAIPVTVVVGIIVLLILMAIVRCFVRCCYRKKDRRPLQQPSMAAMYSGNNNYRSSPRFVFSLFFTGNGRTCPEEADSIFLVRISQSQRAIKRPLGRSFLRLRSTIPSTPHSKHPSSTSIASSSAVKRELGASLFPYPSSFARRVEPDFLLSLLFFSIG